MEPGDGTREESGMEPGDGTREESCCTKNSFFRIFYNFFWLWVCLAVLFRYVGFHNHAKIEIMEIGLKRSSCLTSCDSSSNSTIYVIHPGML